MMMKKKALATALLTLLGSGVANASDLISINPDAGGADPTIAVNSTDWSAGNAISLGVGNAAGITAAFISQTPFQTYAHGTLANFTKANDQNWGGLNLNSSYEWTFAAGFSERVSSLTGIPGTGSSAAEFTTAVGGNNFFNIYYDTTINNNNLQGTGFNDGQLILTGTIRPWDGTSTSIGISSFTVTSLGAILDGSGTNNYPGVTTVVGTGSTKVVIDVNWTDPNFFGGGVKVLSLEFDNRQSLNYNVVNPSACFWDGSGAVDVNGAGGQGTTCTSSIGAVNGVSGPNIMFQTDATSNFTTAPAPEPASLALLGLGLLGLGIARRRRS